MAPNEPKDRDLTKKRDEKSEELKDLSAKKLRQEEEKKVKGGFQQSTREDELL